MCEKKWVSGDVYLTIIAPMSKRFYATDEDVAALAKLDIGVVAICANDPIDYPEDSFESMVRIAKKTIQFSVFSG